MEYRINLYPCNMGKKFRDISILLAFTCHCKLLKNCINKNKNVAMTKSNPFLWLLSFSNIKQIQNPVFTLSWSVDVNNFMIINRHLLSKYLL